VQAKTGIGYICLNEENPDKPALAPAAPRGAAGQGRNQTGLKTCPTDKQRPTDDMPKFPRGLKNPADKVSYPRGSSISGKLNRKKL